MKKADEIKSSEITDKKTYLNRRLFMRAAVMASTATASAVLYKSLNPPPAETPPGEKLVIAQKDQQDTLKEGFTTNEKLTSFQDITNYNNFYEFDTDKRGVAYAAKGFVTKPWRVSVEGLVNKPTVFDLDEILRFPQEDRVYRLRCVEGWSMVIPWIGFPLSKLLEKVEPTSQAEYVAFQTL